MILVTGGTGLVGSHLIIELIKRGKSVRALYREKSRTKIVEELMLFYAPELVSKVQEIDWVKGDILDLVSLEDAFQGISEVYHCAAKVSYAKKEFHELIAVNRIGTANMVNYSLKYDIKKFGYVSSTAAIGGVPNKITTEATKWSPDEEKSGYAVSKYNAEREVWRGMEEGLDAIIINPSIIYGPGKLDESSLTIFQTVKKGLKFYSSGTNAFVDVRDVVESLITLMDSDQRNERYLCIGQNLSFKEMLTVIAEAYNLNPPRICPPKTLAITYGRLNELLCRLFSTTPTITYETAISAYSNMEYSDQKLKNSLNCHFRTLKNSVENVVKFTENRINRPDN